MQNVDFTFADGSPEIWRMILDRMSADSSKHDPIQILLAELINRIPANQVSEIADQMLTPNRTTEIRHDLLSRQHGSVQRFLKHREVRNVFLSRRIVERLESGDPAKLLKNKLDHDLLDAISERLRKQSDAIDKLDRSFRKTKGRAASNCATLLCKAKPGWRPRGRKLELSGADFAGADWPDIQLEGADLRGTNFLGANLTGANLNSARIGGADFSGADLSEADFSNVGNKTKK